MRLSAFSVSACVRFLNERGIRGRGVELPLAKVSPLNSSETTVNLILSVPKKRRITWKIAPPKVACPDGYEGNGGVKFGPFRLLAGAPSGVKSGSCWVRPLPSSATRIPVTGRQKSHAYFESHDAMPASAIARFKSAK